MKSELIIDVQATEVSIALLEEGRLVSLQKEARGISYAVGDIYLAKVKKLMPGLNAAFVNVGYEKDAFLHYLDLGPHYASYLSYVNELLEDKKHLPAINKMKLKPEIDKHGSIADVLSSGDQLLVQIVKEPISSKGPRLTTEISITGRYLVLTPFCDKISVSQKIKSSEEKMRLRQIVGSLKPRNYGVIVRTSAKGKGSAELNNELKTLVQAFEDACVKAQRVDAPALIFEEESRIVGMLRDVFNPDFESITVNDPDVYAQILKYVTLIAPERTSIVKLYDSPEPIFDKFAITRQIKSSFGKTVSFKSGAYIIIEHTEALHVIDVNSGNRAKATNDQESNALEVNLRASDEIARQLRLRDMGGIIVVDFIDMTKAEHRQQLYEHMREVMANDRARHNILPLSKFGLMQITRQRVRPALDITTSETCPCCFGKGEVKASILFTDTLYEKLEYLVNTLGQRNFTMYIHPYVDAYIKKGFFSTIYGSWRRRLGRCFKILPDESLAYLQYRVFDKERNEIQLHDEKDLNQSSASKVNTKASSRGGSDAEDSALASLAEDIPAKKQDKPQKQEKPQPKPKQEPKAKPKSDEDSAPKAVVNTDTPKVKAEVKAKEKTTPRTKQPDIERIEIPLIPEHLDVGTSIAETVETSNEFVEINKMVDSIDAVDNSENQTLSETPEDGIIDNIVDADNDDNEPSVDREVSESIYLDDNDEDAESVVIAQEVDANVETAVAVAEVNANEDVDNEADAEIKTSKKPRRRATKSRARRPKVAKVADSDTADAESEKTATAESSDKPSKKAVASKSRKGKTKKVSTSEAPKVATKKTSEPQSSQD